MGETEMIATWTLFRLQLRIMRWPVICVVGIFLVLNLSPLGHSIEFVVLMSMFLPVLTILSGALIFGVEYQEGARDYIRTRPVSVGMVFWTKTAVLFAISLPAALLADGVLNLFHSVDIPRYSTLLVVWAVLFSFSMWLAQMTILFRDSIRGVLYGALSFVLLGAMLVWTFRWWVIVPELPFVGSEYLRGIMGPWYIRHLTFALGGVMLLPAVVVVTSQWIHQYVEGKIRWFSPSAFCVFSLVLVYVGFAYACLHDDGKPSYQNYAGGIEYDKAGMPQPVPWERADEKREYRGGILAQSLDGKDILAYKTTFQDSITEFYTFEAATGKMKDTLFRTERSLDFLLYGCPLSKAYVVISVIKGGNETNIWSLTYLPYDPKGTPGPGMYRLHETQANEAPRDIQELPDGTLSMVYQSQIHPDKEGNVIRTNYYEQVNLITGQITDSTCEIDVIKKEIEWNSGGLVLNYDPAPGELDIREASQSKDTPSLASIPYLNGFVHHERLAAGFAKQRIINLPMEQKDDLSTTNLFRGGAIRLYDLSNPVAPAFTDISIPYRVMDGYEDLFRFLFRCGFSMRGIADEWMSFLALNDKYLLFFVVDRVAAWDITQRDHPLFIGTAPVLPPLKGPGLVVGQPHNISPIEREDGALGIATMNGIHWFEFPALMKEAQS